MSNIDEELSINKENVKIKYSKADQVAADEYLKQIKGFVSDRVDLAKKSAKRAWQMAFAFAGIAFISIGAVITLLPLKTVEAYMTIVDPQTGLTQVLKPISDGQDVSYGEVLDKYWLQRYMISRISYNWKTIQHNFDMIELMSNDKVFATYNNQIRAKDSPLEVFGEKRTIDVNVSNISFLPTTSKDSMLALIYFSQKVVSNDGNNAVGFEPTQWSATVTFHYGADINTEDERSLNPLGFEVTSYRKDRVAVQ